MKCGKTFNLHIDPPAVPPIDWTQLLWSDTFVFAGGVFTWGWTPLAGNLDDDFSFQTTIGPGLGNAQIIRVGIMNYNGPAAAANLHVDLNKNTAAIVTNSLQIVIWQNGAIIHTRNMQPLADGIYVFDDAVAIADTGGIAQAIWVQVHSDVAGGGPFGSFTVTAKMT